MATSHVERVCNQCTKGTGQVLCGGCDQWFCWKHLVEHRQVLSMRLNFINQEHDQLQDELTRYNNEDPALFSRINLWEERAMQRVRQAADRARQNLQQYLIGIKNKLKRSLSQIKEELKSRGETENYTELHLEEWMTRLKVLQSELKNPSTISIRKDQGEIATSIPLIQVQLHIPDPQSRWNQIGHSIAGGHSQGDAPNQLSFPYDFHIDAENTVFVSDFENHRIMSWKPSADLGEIIAGGRGPGSAKHQLHLPLAMLFYPENDSFLISEGGNRRVIRWPRGGYEYHQILISNLLCAGLAQDDRGFLYASDYERHEVRRYEQEDTVGIVVAGGHGQGADLHQLNSPRNIFVDRDQSLYISDTFNHRVIKWLKGATNGVVVAGGRGQGSSLARLSYPSGLYADSLGTVYVADQGNHRIMRWLPGAQEGSVIVGGSGRGHGENQLDNPASIAFDLEGNLYVADRDNHRIQKFAIE